MNMIFNKPSNKLSLRYASFTWLMVCIRHRGKTKNWFAYAFFLLTALDSRNASARGWHSNSHAPDWLITLVIGVIAIFLLLLSAGAALKYWKEGVYLKSISSSVIFAALSWFLLSWIEWGTVSGILAAIGIIGGSWIAFGASLLLIGFVLKYITGVFFKGVRNNSTEDFIVGVASCVGLVMVLVVQFLSFVAIFIGLPTVIIIKIFDLG